MTSDHITVTVPALINSIQKIIILRIKYLRLDLEYTVFWKIFSKTRAKTLQQNRNCAVDNWRTGLEDHLARPHLLLLSPIAYSIQPILGYLSQLEGKNFATKSELCSWRATDRSGRALDHDLLSPIICFVWEKVKGLFYYYWLFVKTWQICWS